MHNSLQPRKIFIASCLEKINPKLQVYNETLSLHITQLETKVGGRGKRLSSMLVTGYTVSSPVVILSTLTVSVLLSFPLLLVLNYFLLYWLTHFFRQLTSSSASNTHSPLILQSKVKGNWTSLNAVTVCTLPLVLYLILCTLDYKWKWLYHFWHIHGLLAQSKD